MANLVIHELGSPSLKWQMNEIFFIDRNSRNLLNTAGPDLEHI